MTAVGHNDILWTNLSVLATGVARDFADKAAMVTAGYDLIAYDEDGVALASQPTWDMVRSETNGDHQLIYAVPLDPFGLRLTVPATDYASVALWSGIGYAYGPDDIGGAIAAAGAVAVTPTATTDDATMYDGDSIDISVSISETALSSIGAASLAACDTRRANIKLNSAESGAAPTVAYGDLTVAITTDTSGNRVLRITKDAFPIALAVPNSAKSLAATLQVELGESSKLITAASVNLTILWVSKDGALA
jgi:hypothetical protein